MDINEDKIKEEVSSFVSSLQRLLPKKKDLIIIEQQKVKLPRLSDIHYEAKNVFPQCFVGAKLVILREVLEKVKLVQQYNYGKSKEPHKCFSQLIHKEMEPKWSGDNLLVDSSGSATATYTEELDSGYVMRLTSKIKDLVSSETEVIFEKDNEKSFGSMSCSVRDMEPSTLRMVSQWMYKVKPDFCVGTEVSVKPLMYPPVPEYSLSTRYERPTFTVSSTFSRRGYQVCLYKKFAPDLRIATIVHDGNKNGTMALGVALHKNYQNGSELKVFVDSTRCGGFNLQKDVLFFEPHNEVRVLRLLASTLIDKQRRVRFGFGFQLDF